ncbi:MAG: TonB-dependent receptor [Sphingobium sp.]
MACNSRSRIAIQRCLWFGAATFSIAATNAAYAQASKIQQVNIPPQPLAATLMQIGRQASAEVVFASADVREKRAPSIRGALTVEQALRIALQGTTLSPRKTLEGAYVVEQEAAPMGESGAGGIAKGVSDVDIIVTAQRRAERLVDVPISISSIDQQELETKRIDSLNDLTKTVTSLRFEANQPGFQPTLRGIGTGMQGGGVDASVAIYVDGVYLPNTSGMSFDLPNVSNIQVLKGPQGTLFGRNSTGGAILISTAEPSSELTGRVKVTYAKFNDIRAQGYISGPLTENISGGLSVYYRKSDGYFRNIFTGSDNDGRIKMFNIRPDILFSNNDNLKVRLIYEHSYNFNASTLPQVNPNGYAVASFLPGALISHEFGKTAADTKPKNLGKTDSGTMIIDWRASDESSFKSVTNYRHDSSDFVWDGDASSLPLLSVDVPIRFKTFSQELTYAYKSGRIDLVSGLYYFRNSVNEPYLRLNYGPPLMPVLISFNAKTAITKTESVAGFADITWEAVNGLFLTGGARYSSEKKKIDIVVGSTVPHESKRWNSFTPRAVVRYELASDTNIYASYSKGFKSGAFSPPSRVDPETVDAFEAGFKHSSPVFDLNGAAFWYSFKDPQITIFDFKTNTGGAINAGKQRSYGAELETTIRPTPEWRIGLSVAWLNAKFLDFPEATINVPDGLGGFYIVQHDASGTRAPRSPKWSGNASTSYDIDVGAGTVQLAANIGWTSTFYQYANYESRQRGYALVDLNLSFTTADDHWRADLFATNLTNHHYTVQWANATFGTTYLYAAPRVFGASLSYRF